MTPEIAKLATQFMSRVPLEGKEVPAFNAVMHALYEEANKTNAQPTKDEPNEKALD